MSNNKQATPTAVRQLKITVPEDVAEFFERRGERYGMSLSSATSPVLTAMARGEIRVEFTQQPGTDMSIQGGRGARGGM